MSTMQIPAERVSTERWSPPWLRHQRDQRYAWASGFVDAGSLVVDAACGNGDGTRILAGTGARRAIGLDLSVEALGEAMRENRGSRSRFAMANVGRLPLATGAVNVFVSLETIEHVPDDAEYVAEVRRVLKPNGVFLCSTPNRRVTNPGTRIIDRPYNPFHLREYTTAELRAILERAFTEVSMLGQTPYAPAWIYILERIGRAFPRIAVRLHQIRKSLGIPLERPERHAVVPVDVSETHEVTVAISRS